MRQGKHVCRILKEIRHQVAEANDIKFITSECRYQGDCLGTCPKCEEEVRYLERQLRKRKLAGKVVTVVGISAGILSAGALTGCANKGDRSIAHERGEDALSVSVDTLALAGHTAAEDSARFAEAETERKRAEAEKERQKIYQVEDEELEKRALDSAPVMPQFPGGAEAMLAFIRERMTDRPLYEGQGVAGLVIVQFVVDVDGSLRNVRVVRGVDPYIDEEAVRVVRMMPKWKSGRLKDGTKVAVKFVIPVRP